MAETTFLTDVVGKWAKNHTHDVMLVQRLLNAVPQGKGGPMPVLEDKGILTPETLRAIETFQYRATGFKDGRIDPGGKTETALIDTVRATGRLGEILARMPEKQAAAQPIKKPPIAVGKGAGTPIRRKAMEIAKSLLPPQGQLTNGTGPKGFTSCGEFPSRVLIRVPVLRSHQRGAFCVRLYGEPTFLDSFQTMWHDYAAEIEKAYPPTKIWVPFKGNRPKPGDIYILLKTDTDEFQHVGMIVNADSDEWLTADGGQGNGHQSGFVRRQFRKDGEITGEFGNKARLLGWVDLDALWAVVVAQSPNKNLSG